MSSTPPTCLAAEPPPEAEREPKVRAVVTQARGVMEILDVPEPGEPGSGEVIVRPEAVGLCGSDFHYFMGDLGAVEDAQRHPRGPGGQGPGGGGGSRAPCP